MQFIEMGTEEWTALGLGALIVAVGIYKIYRLCVNEFSQDD